MRRPVLAVCLFLLGLEPLASAEGQSDGSATVKAAGDAYWKFLERRSLGLRVRLGLPIEELEDISEKRAKEDAAFAASLLARLSVFQRKGLAPEEALSLAILESELTPIKDAPEFYWLTFPVTPYASPLRTVHLPFTGHAFKGSGDRDHTMGLLSRYADLIGAMETKINPSLKSLTDYLSGDYTAKAPETVGLSQYPGGREYYRYLVRLSTTLAVTPEEVHRIGLAEVERINKEPEEIGERLRAAQRRLLPKVPLYFGKTPKAPYGVARLAPALEGAMTYDYYDPPKASDPKGTYYTNASNLGSRSLLNAAPLIYHELVPGHHFQIALQRENTALPPFRRETAQTAYTEGWGEYASALAGEMGMYEDPYDRAGRLVMDTFLSVRLVVETGMNELGWSRERAIAYMKENTLESDTQIATETLRYSCDIRRFHDMLLGSGSMPLSVLEQHVDWFIAREKARKK